MSKKEQFKNLLKRHGISGCYVSEGFDFEADEPNGTIYLDTDDSLFLLEIYKLFTLDKEYGDVGEDQSLWISGYNPLDPVVPNFNVEE